MIVPFANQFNINFVDIKLPRETMTIIKRDQD